MSDDNNDEISKLDIFGICTVITGSCAYILLCLIIGISSLVLLIIDIVVLLSHTDDIICIDAIYTWLAFATMIQLISVTAAASKNICILIFYIIGGIIVYAYAIDYYGNRDVCMSDATESLYDLMLAYIIYHSIMYGIGAVLLIIIIVIVCIMLLGCAGAILKDGKSDYKNKFKTYQSI